MHFSIIQLAICFLVTKSQKSKHFLFPDASGEGLVLGSPPPLPPLSPSVLLVFPLEKQSSPVPSTSPAEKDEHARFPSYVWNKKRENIYHKKKKTNNTAFFCAKDGCTTSLLVSGTDLASIPQCTHALDRVYNNFFFGEAKNIEGNFVTFSISPHRNRGRKNCPFVTLSHLGNLGIGEIERRREKGKTD